MTSPALFKIMVLQTIALVLSSCGEFGPQANVDVLVPTPPPHWVQAFPDLEFVLVFPDAAGREQTVRVKDPGKPVTIGCSKTGNTPILAYPCIRSSTDDEMGSAGTLRPAGGMYPGSLSGAKKTLMLDWRDGAVASVLSRLLSLGRDVSLINAARLAQYLRDAEDPWTLDLLMIAQGLAEGTFTAYAIDRLACRDISVKAGAGTWFLESPFAPVTTLAEEGTLNLQAVSLGMHGLFSADGRMMLINVGRTGIVVMPIR